MHRRRWRRRCRGRGRGGSRGRCGMGLQLVQQRLELVVADGVFFRRRRCGHAGSAGAVEIVQQRLELAVVDRRIGVDRRGDRCRHHRCRPRQQSLQQRRRRHRQRRGVGQRAHHCRQQIQRFEQRVHVGRVEHDRAVARLVEQVLGVMAQHHHGLQRQKAGAALDRVERAEHGVEQLAVARGGFQADQLLAQALDQLARLDQEVLAQLIVELGSHGGP